MLWRCISLCAWHFLPVYFVSCSAFMHCAIPKWARFLLEIFFILDCSLFSLLYISTVSYLILDDVLCWLVWHADALQVQTGQCHGGGNILCCGSTTSHSQHWTDHRVDVQYTDQMSSPAFQYGHVSGWYKRSHQSDTVPWIDVLHSTTADCGCGDWTRMPLYLFTSKPPVTQVSTLTTWNWLRTT